MSNFKYPFSVLVALFAPVLSFSQAQVSPLDGYTPGQLLQGSPGGSIPISGFEVFNPANSQISINIPLLTIGGRGPVRVPLLVPITNPVWETLAVKYQYNCNQYGCSTGYGNVVQTAGWNPFPATVGQAGAMVSRGAGDYCVSGGISTWHQTLTRLTFSAPDGTQTEFVDTATNGALENQGFNRGSAFIADNGSGTLFASSAAITDPTNCSLSTGTVSGTMTLRDGTRYTISNGVVSAIEDSNGNITKLTSSTITDNLGRTYTISLGSDSTGSYDAISYYGASGASRTIKIRYDNLQNHLASGQAISTYGTLWPGIPGPPTPGGPSNSTAPFNPNNIVSEIDLPDGSAYQFLYDSYADVVQITLPTGGVIQYTYSGSTSQTGGNPVSYYLMTRYVTSRIQLLNGAVVSKMTFPGAGEIDRYDGNGKRLAKETHSIVNSGTLPSYATNYNSWQYDQSSVNTYYDSDTNGGGVLRTQTVSYFHPANCSVNCATAQTVTTTLENGVVKQTTYAYDQYSNVTDQKDYDFGAGSPQATPMREIATTYNTSSSYISANILSLPIDIKTLDGAGTPNLVAEVRLGYDKQGILGGQSGTAIDTTNANTINSTYHDTGVNGDAARGNLTVSQVCKLTSANTCSTWLNYSSNTYDIAGNLIKATDANGNSTSINYTDNYTSAVLGTAGPTFALPTTATNALGQKTTTQYDYFTSKPITITDPNNVQTIYAYNDPLDRITFVRKAAGTSAEAQTGYYYNSPTWLVIDYDLASKGDQALITEQRWDGFGRPTTSYLHEDKTNMPLWIQTDTAYDALGRVISTSAPWRPNPGGPNPGWPAYYTTYTYDGLGRQQSVRTPDGAAVKTSYTGNATTVTDQAGKTRKFTTDALGNIRQVFEDPNGVNYTTTYFYTPANQLTVVAQNTQGRYFYYDAAGRLTSAINPESGSVSYSYDAVGNLLTKTDARGTITCFGNLNGTTCDGNGYDKLYRPTKISYSDGTPTVTYQYDSSTNGIGRLAQVSNSNSTTTYGTYDPLGRVTGSTQTTGRITAPFSYTYNALGELMTESFPAQRRTVTTNYDGAGRPSTLGTSALSTNYISQSAYWTNGVPWYFARGNTVWHAQSLNPLLQPTESYDSIGNASNGFLFVSCPNWGLNLDNYGTYDLCQHYGNSPLSNNSGDNNNGTLQSYAEFQGGPASMPGMSFQQSPIGYDSLNRLTSISDSGGWSRTYNYDQYGNMWVANASGGPWSGITPTTNVYSGTTNRYTRPGWNYDASGNLKTLNGNNANYNAENQLTSLAATNGAGVTLAYDGLGQRVQRAISGTGGYTTIYAYDAFGRLASEYVGGSWSRDYIYWGTGQLIATENASSTPCSTCYFSYDHLGSVRLVTDQNHNVIARHDYLPFGEEIGAGQSGRSSQFGSTSDATQRFTGQIRDQESGEDYFNARYSTASLGRFNSPDPANAGADFLNPQSWNAYAYVLGNPLNSVDPTGTTDCDPGLGCFQVTATGCRWWAFWCWLGGGGGQGGGSTDYTPSPVTPGFGGITDGGGGAAPGGGGASQQSPPQQKGQTCIPPTAIQRLGIPIQQAIANFAGKDSFGVGLGGSYSAGNLLGASFSASRQLVVTANGQAAFVNSWTAVRRQGFWAVVSPGQGGYAGIQVSFSNASTPADLNGTSMNYGYGGGDGFGAGVDVSFGSGTQDQPILQRTLTLGAGAGGVGHGFSYTTSSVQPICGGE